MINRRMNKTAENHHPNAADNMKSYALMQNFYDDSRHIMAADPTIRQTAYGSQTKRDTMGNFLYSTKVRVDPYSSIHGIPYVYTHPKTESAAKEKTKGLKQNVELFQRKFNNRIYDVPTSTETFSFVRNFLPSGSRVSAGQELIKPQMDSPRNPKQNFWSWFLSGREATCWTIYEQAHQMLHPDHWSIAKEEETLEKLKHLTCGTFQKQIKEQVQNKTIEWRLNAINTGTDTRPRILDLETQTMPNGFTNWYLSLNMVSKQTINVWDRMGRPIVTDVERDVNELVTFCHVLPDPEWRGWMLMSKTNMHNVLQLPNSQVTSAVARQKEPIDKADEYTKDEVHSNWHIWSGTREYTAKRRRDYYHTGWNYGGTQESESIIGSGGLEWQMKPLSAAEGTHSTLGKQRLTGKGMPIRLDGKFWEAQHHRKRSQILHRRATGQLPKKTDPKAWIPGQPRPV